ncbi:MAG: hypothetical protein GY913_12800 [Proteobacteria bacterium]|nr:hypothetical protein [Pseudomonadota bacterium]MCP4917785.1 hypothetical protein [Pseudomonadota bacterium]
MILALLGCQGATVAIGPEPEDTSVEWSGTCGLQVEETEVFGVEGDRISFDVSCESGAKVTANLPEGAELDEDGFSWKPAEDQAGDHTVLFQGSGDGFPETASVTLHIADDWEDNDNEPVEPTEYLEEYGLPVMHIDPRGDLSQEYIDARLWWEGVEYASEIKIRGAASASYPKNGFTLDFDDVQLELSDRGMGDKRHLVLISTFDDNAYVRQMLAYDLWNDMADFHDADRLRVRTFPLVVYLDGEYHGLYVAADHIDDEYLGQMGLDRESSLYKAVSHDADFAWKSDLTSGYELKESDTWQPLIDLVTFTGSASSQELVDGADAWIDSEEFIDWWAFVYFSMSGDSAGKNSYLAWDEPNHRMRYAPWDFNHSWGQDWRTLRIDSDYDWDMTSRNKVFDALLDVDKDRVRERWDVLFDGPFSEEALVARLDGYYADVDPSAARDWDKWAGEYKSYGGWSSRSDWTTYEEEKEYLYEWVRERSEWAQGEGRP